jgi:hypothetical protein
MSSQFVEIKSTVFKKFEKESLFQLVCSDIVERFQLWLMLVIILMRNLVEMSVRSSGGNILGSLKQTSTAALPKSFTTFPEWTGQLMGPFIMVLGSEMVVDWLKHAFINKFNIMRPRLHSRFLDVLCKDYYTNVLLLSLAWFDTDICDRPLETRTSRRELDYLLFLWRVCLSEPRSRPTRCSSRTISPHRQCNRRCRKPLQF